MANLAIVALMLVALLFGFAFGDTIESVQKTTLTTLTRECTLPLHLCFGPHTWRTTNAHTVDVGPHTWRTTHPYISHTVEKKVVTGPPHRPTSLPQFGLPPITAPRPLNTFSTGIHTLNVREEVRSVSFPGPVYGHKSLPTVPILSHPTSEARLVSFPGPVFSHKSLPTVSIHSVPTFDARFVSFPGPVVGHRTLPTLPIHSVLTFEARSVSFPGPVYGHKSLPTVPIHSVPTFDARSVSFPNPIVDHKSLSTMPIHSVPRFVAGSDPYGPPHHKSICLHSHCPKLTAAIPVPTHQPRDVNLFPITTTFEQPTPTPTQAGAEVVCVTTLTVLQSPANYGRTKTVYTSTAIVTIIYDCHGCNSLSVHTIPEGHTSGYHFRKTITSSSVITQMTQACSAFNGF